MFRPGLDAKTNCIKNIKRKEACTDWWRSDPGENGWVEEEVEEEEEKEGEQAEGMHPGIRLARLEFPCSSKTDD